MNIKYIKSLSKQKKYDEALVACDNLLQELPESKADILRVRASVHTRMSNHESALQDRKTLFDMQDGKISDYYLAADNALNIRDFEFSSVLLKEVLQLGYAQNEKWFESGAYFLLAYAQMELGQYDDSIAYLDHAASLEADIAMPLPGICGVCGYGQLLDEINKRKVNRS